MKPAELRQILSSKSESLPTADFKGVKDLPLYSVIGRVSRKRPMGQGLVFFELIDSDFDCKCSGSLLNLDESECISVCFTSTQNGENVSDIVREIKLGSIVQFDGFGVSSRGKVQVQGKFFSLIECWNNAKGEFRAPVIHRAPENPLNNQKAYPETIESMNHIVDTTDNHVKGLCKFYLIDKVCHKGENCPYRHEQDAKLRNEWIRMKRVQAAERAADLIGGDGLDPSKKAVEGHRAAVLAKFLVEKFGIDELRSGGVIDIAGGRGELAFELGVLWGISCLVVDPKEAKVNRTQVRRLKSSGLLKKSKKEYSESDEREVGGDLIEGNDYMITRELFFKNVRQVQDIIDDTFFERHPKEKSFFEKATVLVGLHPDQATGYIAQFATKLGKPFAVVPCCVFSHEFPDRFLRCDSSEELIPVKTHVNLCDWLIQEFGGQKDYLNVLGKNIIVYNDRK